ncbi:SMI1/KNR4 family protein [Sphingobacterium hungaricum]
MTLKEKLIYISESLYRNEEDENYQIELLEGMSHEEIQNFRNKLPNQYLQEDVEELIRFSSGFEFEPLEEVRFDNFAIFGREELFPNSIQLAGDGFGNFWILDIDSKGNWNSVYYVCHDPAVVVKQAENLSEFLDQINDLGNNFENALINVIHEEKAFEIWKKKSEILKNNRSNYSSPLNTETPDSYIIADLKNQPNGSGFIWGLSGANTKIIRPTDEPIWIVENKEKRGFFSKLFS